MPEAVLKDPAPRKPVRPLAGAAGETAPPSANPIGDGAHRDLPEWLAQAFAKRGLEPHDGWPPAHHLLTERDLPWEEDEEDMAVHTAHDQISLDLRAGLERRYRDRGDVLVAHELLVYFDGAKPSRRSARRLSPDLLVAFGVPRRDRGSFTVWEEGRAPDFVLEILSEGTWRKDVGEDVGEKVALYEAMGVREYFLFDPHGRAEPRLQAWAYRDAGPKPAEVPVNPSRRRRELPGRAMRIAGKRMRGIHSEVLGLCLCHTDPWPPVEHVRPDAGKVRWFDPVANRLLETYQESDLRQAEDARAAEARARAAEEKASDAEQRAGAAEQRARAAEERANAMAAELEALRARPPRSGR